MYNCSEYIGLDGYEEINVFGRSSPTNFRKEYFSVSFNLQLYVIPLLIIVGVVGNILSFVVWTSPESRKLSSSIYLATLSLSDLIMLLLYIAYFLSSSFELGVLNFPVVCEGFQVLFVFTQYFSVILVLAFTMERWWVIFYPFKRDKICTPKRAFINVSISGAGVSVFAIIQGFAWFYDPNFRICRLKPEWENHAVRVYLTFVEIFMSAVLPILTLVFNILVIKELQRITQKTTKPSFEPSKVETENLVDSKDGTSKNNQSSSKKPKESNSFRQTTMMLLTVSFYLIITTLSAGFCYMLQFVMVNGNECFSTEKILSDPTWTRFRIFQMIKEIIETLAVSHFAFNFIIYMSTSKSFRDQLIHIVTKCRYRTETDDSFTPVRRTQPRQLYPNKDELPTFALNNDMCL